MKVFSGLLVLLFWATPAVSELSRPNCEDLRGSWKTNIGALVNFDAIEVETGKLTGSYQPASLLERHFPLAGFVNSNPGGEVAEGADLAVTLSFSVSFQEHGGITNWTGICRIVDGRARLETQDLVVRPVAEGFWAHVIASHDLLEPLTGSDSETAVAPAPKEVSSSDP